MESGLESLLRERDVLLPVIRKHFAVRQAHLPSDDVLPHHRDCLLLPREDLELLAMSVTQFVGLVLELLPLPAVLLPHLFEPGRYGLHEG